MSVRYYANAPATTLAAACSSSATLVTVDSTVGLPIQYPFTLILDRGQSTEEAVSVTNASGTSLTVARGIDGTTAFAHTIGATVEHGVTAQDVREPNTHINANSSVHGVVGNVVGDSDTQALTNKDLSDATNVFPASLATDAEVAVVQADIDGHEAATAAHGTTGALVGTSDAQTLTNKNLSDASNTFPASLATDSDVSALDTRVSALEAGVDYVRASYTGGSLATGATATATWTVGSRRNITVSGTEITLVKNGLYLVSLNGYGDAASTDETTFRIIVKRNGVEIAGVTVQDTSFGGQDAAEVDVYLCNAGDVFTAETSVSTGALGNYAVDLSLVRIGA